MKINDALNVFAALAQDSRLRILKLLIRTGSSGLAAGDISQRLSLSSATCSFHLKELKNARVVTCDRQGRSLIYKANRATMDGLLAYLLENCCADECVDTNHMENAG